MKTRNLAVLIAAVLAATAGAAVPGRTEAATKDLVREALLQQSTAQRSGCSAVQRTLQEGTDATLVVRTAVEVGYNACQVIHCSLEGRRDPERTFLCDKVIRGAVLAGVLPDVVTRCSVAYCDHTQVAAILGDVFLEPNYCYLTDQPLSAPAAFPPLLQVNDRTPPSLEASPFRF